jgi:deoxyribodipyrimidine photo-lyase
MTQGEKFDPGGDYVRHYVPELRGLPSGVIHRPWEAGEGTFADAGVRLGRDYPYPVVDHKEGRERALAAFGKVKG